MYKNGLSEAGGLDGGKRICHFLRPFFALDPGEKGEPCCFFFADEHKNSDVSASTCRGGKAEREMKICRHIQIAFSRFCFGTLAAFLSRYANVFTVDKSLEGTNGFVLDIQDFFLSPHFPRSRRRRINR